MSDSHRSVDRVVDALLRALLVASVGRVAVPALLILTAIAGFAPQSRAETPVEVTPHQEETVAPYVARIYFDAKANDGSDSYFEILKNDKRVYIQKAKTKGEKFFIGTMYKDDPDAALVKMGMDITGDGQPDLVISEWLGGANCCLIFHIFEIGPTFKKLGTIDAEFGDSGPHFIHPDKDSKSTGLAIQIHDWTFANWNTDFADSPAPKVILRFSDNAYRVAPDLMRTAPLSASDLATRAAAIKSYAGSASGGEWPHAKVSPDLWGTMLDLIYSSHADTAWKFLDDAWPPKVQGKDNFARDFRAQLAKSRYWPAVEAMNSAKPAVASPSPTATK
jgi:hypothetical protein